mmetsp:Transcript_19394/g.22010  ORF Transcript_19394/g.22010 Transcript_19394/m.22010 type:complete len:150 (-) Transcript_19394:631-1080(-)
MLVLFSARCFVYLDHHSTLFDRCIAADNKKFLLLFVGYVTLFSLWITISFREYIAEISYQPETRTAEGTTAIVLYGLNLIVLGFFSAYSVFYFGLLLKNRSFIEYTTNQSAQIPEGESNDFTLYFGSSLLEWFMPIYGKSGKPSDRLES